jgi:hypothetical protein
MNDYVIDWTNDLAKTSRKWRIKTLNEKNNYEINKITRYVLIKWMLSFYFLSNQNEIEIKMN